MTVSDPSDLPSEAEILRRFIEFRLADLHTATPGRIVAFDAAANTATVQPLLQRVYVDASGTETVSSAPLLKAVPVWFPRGGGFRMTWDLAEGDVVLLVFCERSIDTWATSGGEVDPKPRRKHDWSDAVAVPGLAPTEAAIAGIQPRQLLIGAEDESVEVRLDRETGTVTVKGAAVRLAGAAGHPVGRVGDAVTIDDPAFLAWLSALSPLTVAPYTAPISGKIAAGSPKVSAE